MAKLIYSAIASLDSFVEDADGRFDRAAPADEMHAFVNDLERPNGSVSTGTSTPDRPRVPSPDAPPDLDPRHGGSRHRAPGARRRRPSRRRRPARPKGAAGPDLGADPPGRGALGGALSRTRIAGGRRPARVLRRPARRDRRVLAHARLPAAAPGRPGRHPARADAVDDPARRVPRLRGRRPVGDPRAARGARVQRRPVGGPLVRRVRRRVPGLGDRRRGDRPGLGAAAQAGSRPRCWP